MDREKLRKIALLGVFSALVIVMTLYPRIPTPQTKGYINLGDSMILLGVLYFGGWFGAIIGSVGSALADIISGYVHWAPFTFIIKGIEPLLFALFLNLLPKNNIFRIISATIATLWMVLGYFIAGAIMEGTGAAVGGIVGNLFQALGSIIIAFATYALLPKNLLKKN